MIVSDEELLDAAGIDLEVLGNLNNKTMFCQNVHRRISEWNRGGSPFSTILLSIDNYSQLARDYGPQAADLALGVVAQTIRNSVRGMDLVARYDDKTFGLLLPDAVLRNAICIGERLRKDVRRTGIMIEGKTVHFTISLGIVEVSDGDVMASLLERARHSWVRLRCAEETAPASRPRLSPLRKPASSIVGLRQPPCGPRRRCEVRASPRRFRRASTSACSLSAFACSLA